MQCCGLCCKQASHVRSLRSDPTDALDAEAGGSGGSELLRGPAILSRLVARLLDLARALADPAARSEPGTLRPGPSRTLAHLRHLLRPCDVADRCNLRSQQAR